MPANPLCPDEVRRLYYEAGLPLEAVARELHVGRRRVAAIIHSDTRGARASPGSAKLRGRIPYIRAYDVRNIRALRAAYQRVVNGESTYAIEAHCAGVASTTLRKHMRRAGFPPVWRGPAKKPATTTPDAALRDELEDAIAQDRRAIEAIERRKELMREELGG